MIEERPTIMDARTPKHSGGSEKVYIQVTLGIQAVLVVGLSIFLVRQSWENVFLTGLVILLTLLPVFVFKRYRIVIPPEFQLVSASFVFLSVFLGSVAGFYQRFWWWDLLLHAGSGFVLGIVGFLAVFLLNQTDRIPQGILPGFLSFFGVIFAVFFGVLWEIFEFVLDRFTDANMQSLETGVVDTMQDLIVDMVGAIIVAAMGHAYLRTGRYSFIADGIRSFRRKNPGLFHRNARKDKDEP